MHGGFSVNGAFDCTAERRDDEKAIVHRIDGRKKANPQVGFVYGGV
jgi:hypothetical protein